MDRAGVSRHIAMRYSMTWSARSSTDCGIVRPSAPPALTDERFERPLAKPDRAPVLDSRRVTLVPIKGVRGAPELMGGFRDGQEPIATSRSPEGEEKCDNLGE